MSVTTCVILDTRRIKTKSNTYPVKLRVTFERKSQEYQTFFDLTLEEYQKLSTSRLSEKLKDVREKIREIEYTAGKVAMGLDPFSFEEFEKDYILNNPLFRQRKAIQRSVITNNYLFDRTLYQHRFPIFKEPPGEPGRLLSIVLYYIDKLLQEHRIGTAVSYQTSYFNIIKFRGNVRLVEITVSFLNQYESWMLAQDYSKTTVGIYVRQLRTLFNEAIEQGIIKREKYPFGRRKYQPPTGRNVKRSLTLEDVAKLYYYGPTCKQEQWAKDFWFFSYLTRNQYEGHCLT